MRRFWHALLEDVGADRAWVIAPVEDRYPLAANVEVIPVRDIPTVFEESGASS